MSWIIFAQMKYPTTQQALAERLAQKEQVVLVRPAVSIVRGGKVVPFEARAQQSATSDQLQYYRPLHFPERIFGLGRLFHAINRHKLQSELNRILNSGEKRIACYDQPVQHSMVKRLGEDISVYLALDDRTLTVWGDSIAGELELEKRLLAKVDVVVSVSHVLAEVIEARLPRRRKIPVHVMSNGFDDRNFDPFNQWPEPMILRDIPRPRVLVAGNVSERIDWEGVIGCIRLCPDWTWLFVGPAARGMSEKISSLWASLVFSGEKANPPRLVWRDSVAVEEVPAIIAHCDVCAVPYRLNAFTRASSPLKAIEYLAMGSPVISTRIPGLLRYGNAVEWVEEGKGESYAHGLEQLISNQNNPSAQKGRRKAVASETWAHKANFFRRVIYGSESISSRGDANIPVSYQGVTL